MATLDFSMEGVKPAGEYEDVPAGQYLARIESTEKKGVKDKFYEGNVPHEDNGKNFFLAVQLQVVGGPNDGQITTERLNLWSTNAIAVRIAKSTLKSLQDATGVSAIYDADPAYNTPKSDGSGFIKDKLSEHMHGCYVLMTIKPNTKGELTKHYEAPPAEMLPKHETHIADVKHAATTGYAAPVQPHVQPIHQQQQSVQQHAAAAVNPNAKPSWAVK